MPNPLKVGLIGCGAIADRLHAPDLHHSPDAEIVALCDIVKEKAEGLAVKYSPGAAVFADYRELLKDSHAEAVMVLLPNALHAEVAIAAVKSGRHVLVEKPMATSAAEARLMIDAARKADVMLMVNQNQRLAPMNIKAKEVIDSGILGRVLHVTAMFGHGGPPAWCPEAKWFLKKDEAHFGAMGDLGVHKADLIRFLTGLEVAHVSAMTAQTSLKNADVEDNFVACLEFTSGAVGTLAASWTVHAGNADYVLIHCVNGTLKVGVDPRRPVTAALHNPSCEIDFEPPPPANDYPGTWGMDAGGHFARACLGTELPYCTGEDGARLLDIILAAEKAAETGRRATIKHNSR